MKQAIEKPKMEIPCKEHGNRQTLIRNTGFSYYKACLIYRAVSQITSFERWRLIFEGCSTFTVGGVRLIGHSYQLFQKRHANFILFSISFDQSEME